MHPVNACVKGKHLFNVFHIEQLSSKHEENQLIST